MALFSALVLGTVLSACAAPGSAGTGPTSFDDELEMGVPGDLIATARAVEGYPACGNEPIVHDGVTWYPFRPANLADFPEVEAWGWGGALDGGGFGGGTMRVVPAVAAPGPGDDVGTLTIYEGGLAFWRSDSGTLETWLTDQELTYPWVC